MQLLNLTWGAGASVAAGIVLEKYKLESKPIQVMTPSSHHVGCICIALVAATCLPVPLSRFKRTSDTIALSNLPIVLLISLVNGVLAS